MAGSVSDRVQRVFRDPWSWLVTAVGTGSAWAVGLPVVGVAGVGLGMLGVAAGVGMLSGRGAEQAPPPREVKPGTPQHRQVRRLQDYRRDLQYLQQPELPLFVAGPAADAVSAADLATGTATEVALAVDALDDALARAGRLSATMASGDRVQGPVGRMAARRQALLGRLAEAVDGVGEIYAKLLELSAGVDPLLDTDPALQRPDPVAEVNSSLDTVRVVLAEMLTDARAGGPEPV